MTTGTRAIGELVSVFAARHFASSESVEILEIEVLLEGRPGILDVVGRAGEQTIHLPLGLRDPSAEARFFPDAEDPVLGLYEDEYGQAVAFDVLDDAELSSLLLRELSAEDIDPTLVRHVRNEPAAVSMAMGHRLALTVYRELKDGPRPGIETLLALDGVGFNHLAAPLTRWQRSGRDLGMVQEYLSGASSGWALALTSIRDLYASGGAAELAGGDFGADAHRLGTMAARMHIAMAEAFETSEATVRTWVEEVEESIDAEAVKREESLLQRLKGVERRYPATRVHGDFHLGKVLRTEQGWYVGDFDPEDPFVVQGPRSPLLDVATMLWSFGRVARVAAAERDPEGTEGLVELASAWEGRNRDAFLAGYMGVPGITRLVPSSRELVRSLVACFELRCSP